MIDNEKAKIFHETLIGEEKISHRNQNLLKIIDEIKDEPDFDVEKFIREHLKKPGRCVDCKWANVFRFLRAYRPQFQCVKSGKVSEEGSEAILFCLRSPCNHLLPNGDYGFEPAEEEEE